MLDREVQKHLWMDCMDYAYSFVNNNIEKNRTILRKFQLYDFHDSGNCICIIW